ncbi:HAD family hydrolase [Tessaracoccus caeni]|uniref:HAD family hydrolase n=1 Tax=Tessaracoccus caeni TaxID=3031239 RepID=UPI0023DBC1E0|nr:HAD hydrolase-like protein [Tessaracoccus caeni]MDF1489042.1 HAD hydrolase-like protein [Tessaracoccus caeni]
MRVEAVCWDWNGTLFDDVEVCRLTMNRVLAEHGHPEIIDLAAYRRVFRFPIRAFYADLGIDDAAYLRAADRYIALLHESIADAALHSGAEDTLQRLAGLGLRQILASATVGATLHAQMRPHGVHGAFSDILSIDDAYDASKYDVIAAWLTATNIPPTRVVMVGDTNHDLEIAEALGTQFVHFTGGHQSLDGADVARIDSLDELISLLST